MTIHQAKPPQAYHWVQGAMLAALLLGVTGVATLLVLAEGRGMCPKKGISDTTCYSLYSICCVLTLVSSCFLVGPTQARHVTCHSLLCMRATCECMQALSMLGSIQ